MLTFAQWTPVLSGFAAPLLAWLMAAGGTNPRRAALLVALAAVLALLVELALAFVIIQFLPFQRPPNYEIGPLLVALANLAGALTTLLAVAAWTLLLVAAARAGDRRRLVVLAVVFGLVLALQAGLDPRHMAPPLRGLVVWLETTMRGYLALVLGQLAAVVAPIGALLTLATATTAAGEAGAATGAPSAPTPQGT